MENHKWGMVIGVHALSRPEYRQLLSEAEVIFAHDVNSGGNAIVYGRELLERIARSDTGAEAKVLTVELDMDTDELEYLLAAVQLSKGKHDYRASSPGPD